MFDYRNSFDDSMSEAPSPKRRKIKADTDHSDQPIAPGPLLPVTIHAKLEEQDSTSPKPRRRKSESSRKISPPKLPASISAELIEQHPDLEWIVSHVDPNAIIWSSKPDIVPPHLKNIPGLSSADQNCANTWFIQDPTPSQQHDMDAAFQASLDAAAASIAAADAVLFVAGAGIGVDSGLPDYRGPSGFWKDYKGLQDLGLTLEDISHPDWFLSDPEAAWGLYGSRMRLYLEAVPHRGFQILSSIARQKQNNYFVFTSNIDGQFLKSGFDEKKLFESHGTLAFMQCLSDTCGNVWRSNQLPTIQQAQMSHGDTKCIIPVALKGSLPKCPSCGNLARPNVSMFGDDTYSWKSERADEQKARMLKFLEPYRSHRTRSKMVIIELGCGSSLHSLRCDVELLLDQIPSADLIRINPNESSVRMDPSGVSKRVDLHLGALDALVELAKRLQISTARPSRHVSKFKLRVQEHEDYI